MTNTIAAVDVLLFVVLPYVAAAIFAAGTVERLRRHPYSVSSGSSQLLENRQHFWAMVPFHVGIIVIVLGHLAVVLMPDVILRWNARPLRLYALEATGIAFGVLALGGFTAVIVRRLTVPAVRLTTNAADWIVYTVLLVQLATGVLVAVLYPWGSSWSAAVLSPYLASLVRLQPDTAVIAALPFAIKLHVAGAFVLIAAFPFSRLVHVLNVPVPYLWRRPQVVRWYRPPPRHIGG